MAEERDDRGPGPEMPGDGVPPPADERVRTGLRKRLYRLLDRRELAEDTREVLTGMLEMSDRAKTEAVRLVAREARNYLDELKIKEDLLDLVTSHSLEVSLSVHLKPLADAARRPEAPSTAGRDRRSPEAATRAEPDRDDPEEGPDGEGGPERERGPDRAGGAEDG
jgi:hypothetical protein